MCPCMAARTVASCVLVVVRVLGARPLLCDGIAMSTDRACPLLRDTNAVEVPAPAVTTPIAPELVEAMRVRAAHGRKP